MRLSYQQLQLAFAGDCAAATPLSEAEVAGGLAELAMALLRTEAALVIDADDMFAAVAAHAWRAALVFLFDSIRRRHQAFRAGLGSDDANQGAATSLAPQLLLLVGLQAAALHHQLAGRSCIPADPVAAAGHSSSSSGGSGGSGSSSSSSLGGGGGGASSGQQQQPPTPQLLAVPAFHKSLLRQVACLELVLQQPHLVELLFAVPGVERIWYEQLGSPASSAHSISSGSLVPLLQVLVELAVLRAGTVLSVADAVVAALVILPGPQLGLQAAQAAGLLAPVLHLLSAAALHELATPAALKQSALASAFPMLVAAVVLPVEPKHLAAAICQQPLRSLAALELTVRLRTAELEVLGDEEAALRAETLLQLVTTVAQACSEAARSGRLTTALQDSDSVRLASNHLFSLLMSCLKCSSRASATGGSTLEAAAAASAVAQASLLVVPAFRVDSGNSSHGSSGSSSQGGSDGGSDDGSDNEGSGDGSACGSDSGGIVSSCSATHWLALFGRCLGVVSREMMWSVMNYVLTDTEGVRAVLGWQPGEVRMVSTEEAAAVVRAAVSAATGAGAVPATSAASGTRAAGPAAAAGAAAAHPGLAAAAAAAGSVGMVLLCPPSGSNLEFFRCGSGAARSIASSGLDILADCAEVMADEEEQQQQGECGSSRTELALAINQVQQQLDAVCNVALLAASTHYQPPQQQQQPTPDDVQQCLTQAIQRNTRGINTRRGSRGHALLDVLHHLGRLQQLSNAVCAVLPPPSLACANPTCANLSGLSEMQLVWRRGVCGHCRAARFCSVECLRAHWAKHRDPASVVAALLEGGACGSDGGAGEEFRARRAPSVG